MITSNQIYNALDEFVQRHTRAQTKLLSCLRSIEYDATRALNNADLRDELLRRIISTCRAARELE